MENLSFIRSSPLKYPPKPKQYRQLKALIPAPVLLSHKHATWTPAFNQSHARSRTHTLARNLSRAQAYTHIPKPPTPTRHKSHLPLPRISCSSHIMLKWTCIIALAWFVVFVGGYQQPPWCLGQRWSLLQEPQIYIAALTNMLFLWGPIVKMEYSGFKTVIWVII